MSDSATVMVSDRTLLTQISTVNLAALGRKRSWPSLPRRAS